MNKTKIIAYIAFVAMLSACGSDDGSGPPELAKDSNNILISPFDTLKVKFNSNLVGLDDSNVVLGSGKTWLKSISGNELRFIGTNTTLGGSNYFTPGKPDFIEFKNIQNSDGYKNNDKIVFSFITHKMLDIEPNNEEKDANNVESPGDSIINGVTFAGIIDKSGKSDGYPIADDDDFYKLNLKNGDGISITVSSKNALKVNFSGACYRPGCNDKTDSTTEKNKYSIALIDTVNIGHIQTGDIDQISQFYIKISGNTSSRPIPYIVTVKKLVVEKK